MTIINGRRFQRVPQRVAHIVAGVLQQPLAMVTPEAMLMDDLGADSLDGVEIVMEIEAEFRFAETTVQIASHWRVQDLVAAVEKVLNHA
jgi:acyl carrier protein